MSSRKSSQSKRITKAKEAQPKRAKKNSRDLEVLPELDSSGKKPQSHNEVAENIRQWLTENLMPDLKANDEQAGNLLDCWLLGERDAHRRLLGVIMTTLLLAVSQKVGHVELAGRVDSIFTEWNKLGKETQELRLKYTTLEQEVIKLIGQVERQTGMNYKSFATVDKEQDIQEQFKFMSIGVLTRLGAGAQVDVRKNLTGTF